MEDIISRKLKKALNVLLPDDKIDIHTLTDLTDNQNPAIRELCEAADIISRLTKGERS